MNAFNPDYLCNDPECKSRSVVQDMAVEYQEWMDAKNAEIQLLRAALGDIENAEGLGFWTSEWRKKHTKALDWCRRCGGTGVVNAAFSGADPSCPDCGGEVTE